MEYCWKDKLADIEDRYGFGSPEYWDEFATDERFTCLLPLGHSGPHELTNDDDILITFPAKASHD